MSIGENLKKLREKKGLMQSELAERVGISRPLLCQMKRGTRSLSLPLAKEFSEILGGSVEDFYKN